MCCSPNDDFTIYRYSWRAILYYLYTGRITFGRLSSQPPPSREEGAFEKVGDRQPESFQLLPTSPKSVYNLACTVRNPSGRVVSHERAIHHHHLAQIGLVSLRGIAFEDFKSKINPNNVTEELLSPFSAR